jgi:hypothetical protein
MTFSTRPSLAVQPGPQITFFQVLWFFFVFTRAFVSGRNLAHQWGKLGWPAGALIGIASRYLLLYGLGHHEVRAAQPPSLLESEYGDPVAQLDQSTGLLIRGSWVRVPPGSPVHMSQAAHLAGSRRCRAACRCSDCQTVPTPAQPEGLDYICSSLPSYRKQELHLPPLSTLLGSCAHDRPVAILYILLALPL